MSKLINVLATGLLALSVTTGQAVARGSVPDGFPQRYRSDDSTPRKHMGRYRLSGTDAGDLNLYGYRDYSKSIDLQNGWTRLNAAGAPADFLWNDDLTRQDFIMISGWNVGSEKVCGYFMKNDDEGLPVAIRYQELNASDGTTIRTVNVPVSESDLSTYNVLAAFNDFDDYIYGFNYTAEADAIDFVKAPASAPANFTVVAQPETVSEVPVSFCFRPDRNLFFGVLRDGWLVSYDTTGRSEKLFNTGIQNIGYLGSMTWSDADQVFYFNAVLKAADEWGNPQPASDLYKIDPTARKAEQICVTDPMQTFTVLSTLTAANRAEAPAAPEFVSADFNGGRLEGTVTFRLPDRKYNGEALDGSIGWTAYDGETQVKAGYAEAGSDVTVEYASLTQGFHTFRMIADANDYISLPGTHTMFVGYDSPSTPANVKVEGDVVTWDAVTEGANGGYINPSNVEYKIYFIDHYNTDDELPEPVVMQTVKGTSFDLGLDPDETIYAYRVYVVAVANDQESIPTETVKFNYGSPYSIDSYRLRPYADQADVMDVVTYSGAGWKYDLSGWEWFSGASDATPVDSWLILPPVKIDDVSKALEFTLQTSNASPYSNDEYFEIRLGTAPDPNAMDQYILPKCGPTTASMDGEEMGTVFAVSEPGVYYPTIRCVSDPGQSSVVVWNFEMRATENALTAPASATDIVITPGAKGELQASVSFKYPVTDLAGNPIPADKAISAKILSAGKEYETQGKPGETANITVDAVQNANNLVLTCLDGNDEGATIYTRFHAGIGVPGVVTDLHSTVGEDNRSVNIEWGLPEESPEGLYFPDYGITYWLVEQNLGQWSVTEEIGNDTMSYTYNLPEYMTRQYMMPLGIIAENAAGMSPYFASTYHVLGDPLPLPVEEYIPNGETSQQYFSLEGKNVVDHWNVYYVESVSPEMANDSGVALMNYPDEVGQKSLLMLPKFNTKEWATADLNLRIWGGSRLAPTKLLARCFGNMEYRELAVIEPDPAMKWRDIKLTLPDDFGGKGWVEVVLESAFTDIEQVVMIENYAITGNKSGEVDGLAADNSSLSILGHEIVARAGDADASVAVCDVAGRVIEAPAKIDAGDSKHIKLAPGLYIVRLNNKAISVMIR